MTNLAGVSFLQLLPPNLAANEDVQAIAAAVDEGFKPLVACAGVPVIFARIDSLSGDQLDHLAWQFDSRVWRDDWPLSTKRSMAKNLLIEKMKKGTRANLEAAIRSFGSAVRITEWHEKAVKGIPHTADVLATLADIPGYSAPQVRESLEILIDESKPARSHVILSLSAQARGRLGLLAAARAAVFTRISNL